MEKARDNVFFEVVQPFYAFRVLVVANPRFYPEDPDPIRRKLLNLGRSVLEEDKFDVDNIPNYLEGA